MALELYARVAGLYPGISRPAWAAAALFMAIAITMATIVEPHTGRYHNMILLRRASATVLTVAIGLLAALFGYFRNNLPSNLVRHAAIMAIYFVTQALPYLAANLTQKVVGWSLIAGDLAVPCYVAWAVLLTRAGQTRNPLTRRFTDAELAHATDQHLDRSIDTAKSMARRSIDD